MWPPRRRSRQPEKISAAAERLLQRNHGYRYYSWDIHQGGFRYFENAAGLEREKGIEGKSVIATGESGLSVLEVVAISKDLSDVERGFRQLKDVLAMRPIYHQIEQRVKVHICSSCTGTAGPVAPRSPARGGGDRLLGGASNGGAEHGTLGDVAVGGSGGASRGQRGLPGCASGLEGPEPGRTEAAAAPRGVRDHDVVTIRKFDPYPPRGYVDALKRQQITYDEAKTLAWSDRIRAAFSAKLLHDRRGLGDPSCVPVFVIGMPRSGTTLIEQILASHPKVFGAGELRDFGRLATSIRGPDGSEFPECVPSLSGDQLRVLGENYVSAIRALNPAAKELSIRCCTTSKGSA